MVKTLTTWWPVTVYEPSPEKPGTFAEYEFEVEMEILDRDAVKANTDKRDAILAEAINDPSAENVKKVNHRLADQELSVLQRVVRNWRQVEDDDGNALLFTPDAFLQAMKRDHIRQGINVAYAEAIDTGKAREGNSKARP
ncbi:hypothetical protein [Rhizobium sp. 9140]|uniref:hypothetical protein n=1 Tax=Rhizobium sp. 9140 TaxID=1761900 RepID=UPI000B82EC6A|nr:hypothetical protein [Rhizobium sp. 9140]